jgi:hypothetical protein
MAFTKNMFELPTFVSIHRGTLKPFGGELDNMFDARFDQHEGEYSREAEHACHKDFRHNTHGKALRNYRPWQFSSIKSIK